MPLWILSVATVVYMAVLLWTHRRMTLWVKLSLVVPAICLAAIYTVFSLTHVDVVFRQNAGRIGQTVMLIWYIILLLITRKQHVGVNE
jgi:hypothetical protein